MTVRRKIKNVVGNYSIAKLIVREATSNDPTYPTETLLTKIAECSRLSQYYNDVIEILFKRLNDKNKNWRHIFKSLLVIESTLCRGSNAFVRECKLQLPQIVTLCDFDYNHGTASECNVLIRETAKRVVKLLNDDVLLAEERKAYQTKLVSSVFNHQKNPSESIHSFKLSNTQSQPDYNMNRLSETNLNNHSSENHSNLNMTRSRSNQLKPSQTTPTLLKIAQSASKLRPTADPPLLDLFTNTELNVTPADPFEIVTSRQQIQNTDLNDVFSPTNFQKPFQITESGNNCLAKDSKNVSQKELYDVFSTSQYDNKFLTNTFQNTKSPLNSASVNLDITFNNSDQSKLQLGSETRSHTNQNATEFYKSMIGSTKSDQKDILLVEKTNQFLGEHASLVDLENLCTLPKPPPKFQTYNTPKPTLTLNEMGAYSKSSDNWDTLTTSINAWKPLGTEDIETPFVLRPSQAVLSNPFL